MRSSGILLHISSLSSPYGIGTFGEQAYQFVDFLKESGQSFWQILPLSPTSYGDSPYQSFSVFAGNPYFIDLDQLKQQGLLLQQELDDYPLSNPISSVDYSALFSYRYPILRKAYQRFQEMQQHHASLFQNFCSKNCFWLDGFSLFMTIKQHFNHQSWQTWPEEIRTRSPEALSAFEENKQERDFHRFVQFLFFQQLSSLKQYANQQGIKLIGDMPIYVAEDSADVWCNPHLFLLDSHQRLIELAGCPPDYFSIDGQAWGNPIYNWGYMSVDKYAWWISRVEFTMTLCDIVRIDHFRAFSGYFSYPAGETPRQGSWKKGPGIEIFHAIKQHLPDVSIIAEDLGFLDQDVHDLLNQTGFPGMKILQFAFDSREQSDYLPHHYDKNCVVYTGTHDNDTVAGWCLTANQDDVKFAGEYFHIHDYADYPWAFIQGAWASVANLAIAPMQDFLNLDTTARMNTPSTLGKNWTWRMSPTALTPELSQKIYKITKLYGRLRSE